MIFDFGMFTFDIKTGYGISFICGCFWLDIKTGDLLIFGCSDTVLYIKSLKICLKNFKTPTDSGLRVLVWSCFKPIVLQMTHFFTGPLSIVCNANCVGNHITYHLVSVDDITKRLLPYVVFKQLWEVFFFFVVFTKINLTWDHRRS